MFLYFYSEILKFISIKTTSSQLKFSIVYFSQFNIILNSFCHLLIFHCLRSFLFYSLFSYKAFRTISIVSCFLTMLHIVIARAISQSHNWHFSITILSWQCSYPWTQYKVSIPLTYFLREIMVMDTLHQV